MGIKELQAFKTEIIADLGQKDFLAFLQRKQHDLLFENVEKSLESSDFKQNTKEYETAYHSLQSYENIQYTDKLTVESIGNIIIRYDLPEKSQYFKGFVYLVYLHKRLPPEQIMLKTDIWHTLQARHLSCEANTFMDFVNFYYLQKDFDPIDEETIIGKMPFDTGKLWYGEGDYGINRYWGDPDKAFIWDINGRQSARKEKFSGYGIHAKPLIPMLNEYLKPLNLSAVEGSFNEQKVTQSLMDGHPVMFRYVHARKIQGRRAFSPFTRTTPDGKETTVHIGEHVGLIVGADFDKQWKITHLYYYNGLDKELQRGRYEDIKYIIELQDMAIYVQENGTRVTSIEEIKSN